MPVREPEYRRGRMVLIIVSVLVLLVFSLVGIGIGWKSLYEKTEPVKTEGRSNASQTPVIGRLVIELTIVPTNEQTESSSSGYTAKANTEGIVSSSEKSTTGGLVMQSTSPPTTERTEIPSSGNTTKANAKGTVNCNRTPVTGGLMTNSTSDATPNEQTENPSAKAITRTKGLSCNDRGDIARDCHKSATHCAKLIVSDPRTKVDTVTPLGCRTAMMGADAKIFMADIKTDEELENLTICAETKSRLATTEEIDREPTIFNEICGEKQPDPVIPEGFQQLCHCKSVDCNYSHTFPSKSFK